MKHAFRFPFRFLWLGFGFLAACGGGGSGSDGGTSALSANRAPTLTSPIEAVFPQTRTGAAYRITGSDPDGDPLRYSISGTDARFFTVNQDTGEVSFVSPPDVDAPAPPPTGNFYFIDVTAQDPSLASATQQVIIEVARHDPQGPFLARDGAVFLGPNTIVESDPSRLQSVSYLETTRRTIPDNRVRMDTDTEVHVFVADFDDGQRVEMVVNTALAPLSAAEGQAGFYARILGQLDPIVTAGVQTVWIQPGDANISGPVGGIVVHTGTASAIISLGAMEEAMAQEAVHATLDPIYLDSPAWQQSQKSDVTFVSEYARDFVETEDLAESYNAYLIVKYAARNPPALVQQIENGIPARLAFFRSLGL
jgi:hypothetical protein